MVKLAVDTFGKIDVLISNAAVNPAAGSILEYPDWGIDKMLAVNIRSPIQLVREAHPHMSKAGTLDDQPHHGTCFLCKSWLQSCASKRQLLATCACTASLPTCGHSGLQMRCFVK